MRRPSRAWARRAFRGRGAGRDDGGFSLVELVVVLVILPIIAGAIATTVITTENSTGATQARLGDSQNAQIASAYFGRDVQGAQFLTTASNLGAPYTAQSPQACGSGSTLLVALYRPAAGASALSVGYWATTVGSTPQVVRDACTLSGTYTTTVTSQVVVSDDVSTPAAASVTPAQFASAAASGWTPTSATTTVSVTTALSSATTSLPVASTLGFLTGAANPLSVLTSAGAQTITCLGASTGAFTGCSGFTGTSGTAVAGSAVTQSASVASVDLSLAQPGSRYTFSLVATPRAWSSQAAGSGALAVPALLTLGTGVTVQGGHDAVLTIDGVVDVNGGTLSCSGNPTVTAYGFEATAGSAAIGCGTGGPTTTAPAMSDPLAPYLPSYPSTSFPQQPLNPARRANGACAPGEYTASLGCSTLEPGVYVLDAGLNLGNGTLAMASDAAAGQGVLLYLPCDPPAAPSQCSAGVSMGGNGSLSLVPLSAAQATQSFASTALAGVLVWQDARDASAATFGGTPAASTLGMLYLPAAALTFQGNAGATAARVIAADVALAGSTPLTITGP